MLRNHHDVIIINILSEINEVVDWDSFARKLLGYYRGKGETGKRGRDGYGES